MQPLNPPREKLKLGIDLSGGTILVYEVMKENLSSNFSIDELKVNVDIAPGQTGSVTITAPAGTYQFYFNLPGHKAAGMFGTLTVR